jgi:hypothetical protein
MAFSQWRAPRFAFALLLACGWIGPAAAAQPAEVKDAWVRAPAPGQTVAGVYMDITGRTNHWLIAVASPVASRAELHAMAMEDGVMKMRPVEKIGLPGGRAVKLAPGGLHIMLFDLKRTLKRGEKVPITLTVLREDMSNRATFTVHAEVRDPAGATGHHH